MTHTRLADFWRRVPAALALSLLVCQLAVPWTVPRFITQDGPSHLYSSEVMADLVFHHKTSNYSPLYTVQRRGVPNWTANLLLAAAASLAGTAHAEALLVTITMLIGFAGWCYCARDISPLANAMLPVWFVWMGFYNFYLGMLLLPFVLGYYRRHAGQLSWKQAGGLAAAVVLLWLTHPVPAAIAFFALPLMAFLSTGRTELFKVAALLAPTLLLLAIYALTTDSQPPGAPHAAEAWRDFPMHVFQTGPGYAGAQVPLVKFLEWYFCIALLLFKWREWRSPLGGLAAAAAGCFLLYLFLPNSGLGGGMVKIRFSWALFVIGGIAAWNVSRLKLLRAPIALAIALLVAWKLPRSIEGGRRLNDAASDYFAAAGAVPERTCFVRLHYPTPDAPARFGYEGMGVDPWFHLDGRVAAQSHSVDLTDYEPITRLFPVVYKKTIDPAFQYSLWAFEGPRDFTVGVLKWIAESFPARIGYVLVVGDETAPEAISVGMPQMLAFLDSRMCRLSISPSGWVRLYRNGVCTANAVP